VASVTGELLVVETVVDLLGTRRPAAAFYPDRELAGDPSNWWGPNPAAVVAMLRSVGFPRVEVVTPAPSWRRRLLRAAYRPARPSVAHRPPAERIAVHARRA
jgi:hypothetical protein